MAIREYARQVEQLESAPYQAGRPDRVLWTLIQGGLLDADKEVLSPAHQQVKRFAAVGMSRLLQMLDDERERSDRLELQIAQVDRMARASDQETTVVFDARDKLYPLVQDKINQVLESGTARFDRIEEALEEKVSVPLLSELTMKLDVLQRRVDEQDQVIGQVSR